MCMLLVFTETNYTKSTPTLLAPPLTIIKVKIPILKISDCCICIYARALSCNQRKINACISMYYIYVRT